MSRTVLNEHGLTEKQEKFCQEFMKNGGNASGAYRAAYDCSRTKPASVNSLAKRLLDEVKITSRIRQLRSKVAQKHDITIDKLVAELEEARKLGLRSPRSAGACVNATMGKAKLLGFDKRAELCAVRDFELENVSEARPYLGIPAHLVGPSFGQFYHDVLGGQFDEFWLKGGRGSLKSTTVSEVLPDDLIRHSDGHAVVLREVYATQKDSCYSQLIWAIDQLGLSDLWTAKKSPLELVYRPTGQMIYFRGLDDALKLKSIKPPFGYIRDIWFEEVAEVDGGMETIRNVKQSLKRGGEKFNVFYSYNPPKSKNNWVNRAAEEEALRPGVRVYHTDYRTVPRAWLGEPFIIEAEYLKSINPKAYEHEYLGIATGTGGDVFDNVVLEEISADFEPKNVRFGIDFGFGCDPFAWGKLGYSRIFDTLYILDEFCALKLHDDQAADEIKARGYARENHFADCEDPKAISSLNREGVNVHPCKKFKGSRNHGYKFLQRWARIVIDPKRCPNAAREFTGCEYQKDKDGHFLSVIPDGNDHIIDLSRYALDREIADYCRKTTTTYIPMG